MALRIRREACADCHLCAEACPVQAIVWSDAAGFRGGYVILSERCTECVGDYSAPRCVAVCPSEAIEPDPDYAEGRSELREKWQRLTGGRSPYEAAQPVPLAPPEESGEPGD